MSSDGRKESRLAIKELGRPLVESVDERLVLSNPIVLCLAILKKEVLRRPLIHIFDSMR